MIDVFQEPFYPLIHEIKNSLKVPEQESERLYPEIVDIQWRIDLGFVITLRHEDQTETSHTLRLKSEKD
jgi:hypothetical protein